MKLSEIQITFVRPNNGLVAFASFVLDDAIYCGSIAVMTRPTGEYRLVFPTKTVGTQQISVFYPINQKAGRVIEQEVIKKIEEVMSLQHDRHYSNNLTSQSI